MSYTVKEIAELVSGTVIGADDTPITGGADVQDAEEGDLVFAESTRFLEAALRSRASAILVGSSLKVPSGSHKPLILVDNPRIAFVQALESFVPAVDFPEGVDPSARIGSDVRLGAAVSIGAQVWVGDRVTLGDRVILRPGVRVGDGCVIGNDTLLHPNVVLYPGVTVGVRCILHAGSVIGADGFGYVPVGAALKKVPHLGSVWIGDDVEIGANTCIDRAKTGMTVIDSGTKIDNLVHIAHNVHMGRSCLIIAQVGIAGSVDIGNGVILAGQAGIADHIRIGDGARVGAQGGVIGDVAAGETVSGYPARPHRQKMREHAASSALPEYIKRIRDLEKRLAELEDSREKGKVEREK